jgi:hypothetical protein
MKAKKTIVWNVSQSKSNTNWWEKLPIKGNLLYNMLPLLSLVHGNNFITNFKIYVHQNHKIFNRFQKTHITQMHNY